MKKILCLLVLIFSMFLLSSCKINEVTPNEGSVTLDLSENYKKYIDCDEIPSFTFTFDGTLNTITNVTKSYYTVFSNNEDIILSDAIAKLLSEYEGKVIYEIENTDTVSSRLFSTLDENGKVKNIKMTCDDNTVYDEIAYIPLSNGINLTIDYCRFVSEGKTYYTWRYSRSIAFYMYYPIMKIKRNDQAELVLFTVPNCTSIHVTPDLSLAKLMSNDNYYNSSFYSIDYYDPTGSANLDEEKAFVWDYYADYNMSERSDDFTFTYLNNKFECKMYDTNYVISWLERI